MTLPTAIAAGDPGHISAHQELHTILTNVELADGWDIARIIADLLANQGAAGVLGSLFYATDQGASGELSLDNGSSFLELWRLMPSAEWDLRSGSSNDNIASLKVPGCRIGRSVAQSIADDSSYHAINWDDETGVNNFNNEGTSLHDPAVNPSRLKATRSGLWACGAFISWNSDPDGRRLIRIQKNNGAVLAGDTRAASASGDEFQTIYGLAEMVAGDYLQIECRQNSGGALDVQQNSVAYFHFVSDG